MNAENYLQQLQAELKDFPRKNHAFFADILRL